MFSFFFNFFLFLFGKKYCYKPCTNVSSQLLRHEETSSEASSNKTAASLKFSNKWPIEKYFYMQKLNKLERRHYTVMIAA